MYAEESGEELSFQVAMMFMKTQLYDVCTMIAIQSVQDKVPWYRVSHLLANLGWVDVDLGCSITLLGQELSAVAAP